MIDIFWQNYIFLMSGIVSGFFIGAWVFYKPLYKEYKQQYEEYYEKWFVLYRHAYEAWQLLKDKDTEKALLELDCYYDNEDD